MGKPQNRWVRSRYGGWQQNPNTLPPIDVLMAWSRTFQPSQRMGGGWNAGAFQYTAGGWPGGRVPGVNVPAQPPGPPPPLQWIPPINAHPPGQLPLGPGRFAPVDASKIPGVQYSNEQALPSPRFKPITLKPSSTIIGDPMPTTPTLGTINPSTIPTAGLQPGGQRLPSWTAADVQGVPEMPMPSSMSGGGGFDLGSALKTGVGVLGGVGALAGLFRGSGSGAYDKGIGEAWDQYDKYSNPNSDWYQSAYQRYQQLFADSSPTVNTLDSVARQGGSSVTSASALSGRQAQAMTLRNRENVNQAMLELYRQGGSQALSALGLATSLEDAKATTENSWWQSIMGGGVGLLGLLA